MADESPTRLFDLLLALLLAENMPEATVVQRLKAVAKVTRHMPERLGRKYLVIKGTQFQLTAVFEKPSFNLYQVTLRLQSAAYAQVKAHARALPAVNPTGQIAEWRNDWFGLLPQLLVRPPAPGIRRVTVPNLRFVVLTRA
jgi:hypothetical protein